ncbi:unnamed protein product [Boreogadus saida]
MIMGAESPDKPGPSMRPERLSRDEANSRAEMNPGLHIVEGDQTLIIITKQAHLLGLSTQRAIDIVPTYDGGRTSTVVQSLVGGGPFRDLKFLLNRLVEIILPLFNAAHQSCEDLNTIGYLCLPLFDPI